MESMSSVVDNASKISEIFASMQEKKAGEYNE
jgi:hypothetical protein